jgi:hypothetical protein
LTFTADASTFAALRLLRHLEACMRLRQATVANIIGILLFAAPLAVSAQETTKIWRIGYLAAVSAEFDQSLRAALQQGLRDLGYVEGKIS